jgi:predicted transcriptional regulator
MKISKEKKQKISEQILSLLYSLAPKPVFTYYIAKEIARDEEFVKKLLIELKTKGLVNEIKRNSKGKPYKKRTRWVLTDRAFSIYQKYTSQNNF